MEQQKIIDNAETLAAKIVTVEFSLMKLNELLQLAEDTENTIEALQEHREELCPDKQKVLKVLEDNRTCLAKEIRAKGYIIVDSEALPKMQPRIAKKLIASMDIQTIDKLISVYSKEKDKKDNQGMMIKLCRERLKRFYAQSTSLKARALALSWE